MKRKKTPKLCVRLSEVDAAWLREQARLRGSCSTSSVVRHLIHQARIAQRQAQLEGAKAMTAP